MLSSLTDCQVTERCALIVVARIIVVSSKHHVTRLTATVGLSSYVVLLVLADVYGKFVHSTWRTSAVECLADYFAGDAARSSEGLTTYAKLFASVIGPR